MSLKLTTIILVIICLVALVTSAPTPVVLADDPTVTATTESGGVDTSQPTQEATQEATAEPTTEATSEPTSEASAEPTVEATEAPPQPTGETATEPTVEATEAPPQPTGETATEPTVEATEEATPEPTGEAATQPTVEATAEPTQVAPIAPLSLPPAATLISPSGTINDNTPTYVWNKVSTATWYYLWVIGPSGTPVHQQWYTSASVCSTLICSVTPSIGLVNGNHTWWIQTWNPAGYGPWSLGKSFTVQQVSVPVNGNFESGPVGWTQFSSHGYALIVTSFPGNVTPHSGSWAVWLGGAPNEISYIRQQVVVPVSSPYLAYWHWIASVDSCGYDFGGVIINSTVVSSYNLCSSTNTGGWVKRVVNLSSYAGQSISLRIQAETDSSLNSNLFIDDVRFQTSTTVVETSGPQNPNLLDLKGAMPKSDKITAQVAVNETDLEFLLRPANRTPKDK